MTYVRIAVTSRVQIAGSTHGSRSALPNRLHGGRRLTNRTREFCNQDSYMQSRLVLAYWTAIFASSRLRACVRMTTRMC